MSRRSPDEPEPVGGNATRENDGRESTGVRLRGGDEPAWMWTDDDFTASSEFSPDFDANFAPQMPTRPALGAAIWRRAWLWGATALLGLALGGVAFVVFPPPYMATTSVLLAQSPNESAQDQILTEVALVESRTVAQAALRSLGQPLSVKAVERFSAGVSATSLTNRVVQITVKGTSSGQAVSAAKATATAFLLIRNDELRSAERGTIASLTQQISKDKQHLDAVTAEIAALIVQPLTASQQRKLAGLDAQQSQLKGAISGLEQAAATFESTTAVVTATMVNGSQVLDPAIPAPRSAWRYPLLYFGGGLLGGLVVGLGFVIAAALVSRRLRRRDEIACALGGPVLLSVGRVRPGGLFGRSWPTVARRPAVRQIVAYLRRSLPVGQGTSTLVVVAADDLRVPALTLVSLASSYAAEGNRVLIADLTPGMAAGRLLGVTEIGVKLTEADGHEVLVAVPEPGVSLPQGPVKTLSPADQPLEKAYRTADIMLTLATLDPAVGAGHLATWAGDAVVMLTAGMSSATKIHAVGEMIRAAGTALTSAVLLGADRSDESLGLATRLTDVNAEPAPDRVRTLDEVGGADAEGAGDEKAASDKIGDSEPMPIDGRDIDGRGGMIGGEPSRASRR